MSDFTPGPWVTEEQWTGIAIKACTRTVARTSGGATPAEYANARLLAAAPSLLAALEGLLGEVRQEICSSESCATCTARERARAAMRAARGQEDA